MPAAPEPITIGDLGTVEVAGIPTTGFARTATPEAGGNNALSLSVTKTSTANTVQVADAVTAKLNELGAQHSDVVTVAVVSDLSSFIKESRDGLLREGGTGALFAVLTIFFFLWSLRSTLVAAVSIPLSLLAALVIMQLTGISLNIMTLGGLAVAVGRVVDDAIVVLENIYRHRALGEDRLTASLNGPREVAGAITAATVTTVGVFLPLGFVGGFVSQFFLPFALTVTFALLASLVCALTVVPVLAFLLIKNVRHDVDEDGEPKRSFWVRTYTPAIKFALRSRWTKLGVVGASVALFFLTGLIAPLLPTQFINAGSEKILAVTVAPPAGTSSEAVLAQAVEAETILLTDPKVILVQTSIPGEGEAGLPDDHRGPERSAGQQRTDDRAAGGRRRPHGLRQAPGRRARPDPHRRLRHRRHPRRPGSPRTPSTSSCRARTRRRSRRSTTRSSRPSPTTPISSTSSRTCRAGRRRSGSRPIPTRRSSPGSPPRRSPRRSGPRSSAPPRRRSSSPTRTARSPSSSASTRTR